jgi:hypothetical protein
VCSAPHRERAGAAGGVDNLEAVDGIDERLGLFGAEGVRFVGGVEQLAQAVVDIGRVGVCLTQRVAQHMDERLFDHELDDFAWGVVGACGFAGGAGGFGVVGCEQVLEHLARQFGVERNLLV